MRLAVALLATVSAVASADDKLPSLAKVSVDIELVTQGRYTDRAGENLSELRLDRGELGARVALGPQAMAELRVESIRSAAEGGSLGIDGDSTVIRVKYAQLVGRQALADVGSLHTYVEGAAGFVPDPWIATLETDYALRALSRTGSERLLGWPTSDLSLLARGALGPVRASVTFGNGEGLRYPERNTGKTTTAVLDVVAVDLASARVTVSGVIRDGSIGVASIRDRRLGGGAGVVTPWGRSGLEVVRAFGIGERADAEATLLGGWLDARVIDHVFASARGQTLHFTTGGGRLSSFGGAVAVEAYDHMRVWLAVEHTTSTGNAMPLPGADPGDATVVMLVASARAPFEVR